MSNIETKINNIQNQLDFLQNQIDAINEQLENETDQDVIDALTTLLNNFYTDYNNLDNFYNFDFIPTLPTPSYNVTDNEWQETDNIEKTCNNQYSYNVLTLSGETELVSDTLSISDFNFNIPYNAIISGIVVKVNKFAAYNNDDTQIFDNEIRLFSNTIGVSESKPNGNPWSEYPEDVYYGSDNDLWGFNPIILTPNEINSDTFTVLFNCVAHDYTLSGITNVAYVDCVCVDVYYRLPGIEDGKIYIMTEEKNTVFDDRLYRFGETGELINSKINEIESPLKIKDNDMDKSIYPIIDEFGYNFNKKFIFKSSWDNDYYIRTKKDLE